MYTVDGILSDTKTMDDFITSLKHHRITNRSGFSHGKIRTCYWNNGILLVSRYCGRPLCEIFIASDRSAKCIPGCNNPTIHGDPFPYLDKGKFIEVWSDGEWIKQGPWIKHIAELVTELISILKVREEEKIRIMRETTDSARQRIKEEEQALIEEWS